jgi:hypothetical protein
LTFNKNVLILHQIKKQRENMNYEEMGKLVINLPQLKIIQSLIKKGFIRSLHTEKLDNTDPSNFEITEFGKAILNGEKYQTLVSEEFLEEYMRLFSKQNLQGINKKAFSPKNKVLSKLESFMRKYKVSSSEILHAVDYYHQNADDIRYTLDAQYFIERDGGSLLIDTINEMKEGIFSNQDKLVF